MVNQVILVGKTKNLNKHEKGVEFVLEVNDTLIPVKANEGIGKTFLEAFKEGMTVGVKGEIQQSNGNLTVNCQKITYVNA